MRVDISKKNKKKRKQKEKSKFKKSLKVVQKKFKE